MNKIRGKRFLAEFINKILKFLTVAILGENPGDGIKCVFNQNNNNQNAECGVDVIIFLTAVSYSSPHVDFEFTGRLFNYLIFF